VRAKADVIVAQGTPAALAAKNATAALPIVFTLPGDPVGIGLVASLARPGGNVTGLSSQTAELGGKRLDLLREIVPGLRRLAIMGNVGNAANVLDMNEFQAAAHLEPSENNLFDWGGELLLHRTLDPAVLVFEKATKRYPNSARLMVGLGMA